MFTDTLYHDTIIEWGDGELKINRVVRFLYHRITLLYFGVKPSFVQLY